MQPLRHRHACVVLLVGWFSASAAVSAQVERAATADAYPRDAALTAAAASDTAPRTATLLDAPVSHDALFHIVSGAYIAAASTDLSISMYQIGRGAARERAFGAQWQDNPVAFAVTKSALAATFAYGMQRLHKRRPKTAIVLGIAATAFEGWLTVRGTQFGVTVP